MLNKRTTILLCVLVGVSLEVVIGNPSGRRESWDSNVYWSVGFPAALVAAVVIGVLARGSDWVWTLAIVPSQVVAMAFKSRDFGLLGFTLVFSSILGVLILIASFAGMRLRGRRGRRPGA